MLYLSSEELSELILQNEKLIILDCREFFLYNGSHIQNAFTIGGSKTFQDRLMNFDSFDKFFQRFLTMNNILDNIKDYKIILYDELSPLQKGYCRFLYDCIYKLNSNLYFLEKGFIDFSVKNSNLCVLYPEKIACDDIASSNSDGGLNDLFDDNSIIQKSSKDFHKHPPMTVPSRILDYLYIGCQDDANSHDVIQKHGITHVINASTDGLACKYVDKDNFLRINIKDSFRENIKDYFSVTFDFIERVRSSNSRVLIHCQAGISRSPTIAIAYLMKHNSWTMNESFEFIKKARSGVSPNFSFLGQLIEYEKTLEIRPKKVPAIEIPSREVETEPKVNNLLQVRKDSPKMRNGLKRPSSLGFSLVPPNAKVIEDSLSSEGKRSRIKPPVSSPLLGLAKLDLVSPSYPSPIVKSSKRPSSLFRLDNGQQTLQNTCNPLEYQIDANNYAQQSNFSKNLQEFLQIFGTTSKMRSTSSESSLLMCSGAHVDNNSQLKVFKTTNANKSCMNLSK